MYKVIMFPLTLAKEPHYSDDFTGLTNASLQYSKNMNAYSPDQCSISYLFTPPHQPFASSYYGLLQQKMPAGYNEHTKCAYTRTIYLYDYGVTCMSVLYFHACTMVFKVILLNTTFNTQHCMNGEPDNSRMYVYMHLAFKELTSLWS